MGSVLACIDRSIDKQAGFVPCIVGEQLETRSSPSGLEERMDKGEVTSQASVCQQGCEGLAPAPYAFTAPSQ